jgi:transcriptional regulator with XRE-family HTH domain
MVSIPFAMPRRIGIPKIRPKIYLAEHREALGLTQKQLADKLGAAEMTVSRWERGENLLNTEGLATVAFALWGKNGQPEDLFYPPGERTPNQVFRGLSNDARDAAMKMIKGLDRE